MKYLLVLFSFIFITNAQAQDERYFNSNKSYHSAHNKQVKIRHKAKHYAQRQRRNKAPVPAVAAYRGETYSPDPVEWVTRRVARVAGEVFGGRPSGAPSAWCGFWLGRHLGLLDRRLWLARNWASVGAPSSRAIGSIVVWRHHVGLITDVLGARIKVLSGNDGHRVRNRWRNIDSVIAYRKV